jgi:mannosyl-3-phosphoglycerate phosphatase
MIIYTDLDGTLLDYRTYSCTEALPALRAAMARAIPVVFCSSKTRAEIEVIRQFTLVTDPFIVENGGAICVPDEYFPFPVEGSVRRDGYDVIELGTPHSQLVKTLHRLREDLPRRLICFSDMSAEEVAVDCGLTLAEARRAKQREYDEPFRLISPDPSVARLILQRIEEAGLRYSIGGRYYHLHGDNDKGRAVRVLNGLFNSVHGAVRTVGLGDSLNDLPMLAAVDVPILMKKLDGCHDQTVIQRLPHVRLASGIGPRGWKTAVMEVLTEFG